jgi:hypothetical protein
VSKIISKMYLRAPLLEPHWVLLLELQLKKTISG